MVETMMMMQVTMAQAERSCKTVSRDYSLDSFQSLRPSL